MACQFCGNPTEQDETVCPQCKEQHRVIILTPEENRSFQGMTINQDSDDTQADNGMTNPRVHVRYFNLDSGQGKLWHKLMVAVVILAVLFFVLPAVFLLILVSGSIWFLLRLLRR